MCPFCLASMGLIVAGATSAGGLAAFGREIVSQKNRKGKSFPTRVKRSSQDVNPHVR